MGKAMTLAVGLAAIDALLCAFVAMFAMAIVLQEEVSPERKSSPIGMFEVQLNKRAITPTDPIQMSAGISLKPKGCEKIWMLPSQETRLDQCGLSAVWRDCKSENGPCRSRLLIQGLRPNMDIDLQITAVSSGGESGEARQEVVAIDASLFDGLITQKLPPSQLRLGDVDGIVYKLRVDSSGRADWAMVRPVVSSN